MFNMLTLFMVSYCINKTKELHHTTILPRHWSFVSCQSCQAQSWDQQLQMTPVFLNCVSHTISY